MRDLLFSVPWYLPTIVAIVGLALWVNGNRRQNGGLRSLGLAVIVAAIGWALISYLVDTPKEICDRQTRQFVQSVVDRDWERFGRLMGPNVTLVLFGSQPDAESREHWVDWVKARAQQIDLKSAAVTDLKASESGDTVTTTFSVWSDQEISAGQPINSGWEIDWHQSDGHWLVHEIRGTRVGNIGSDQIRGALHVH